MTLSNPKALLPKSAALPPEIRDQFVALAKTLEPFEQAGLDALENGPAARREFSEMMEWNGVLGPAFGKRVEKIGRALFADWKRREHEFVWKPQVANVAAFVRSSDRLDDALDELGIEENAFFANQR